MNEVNIYEGVTMSVSLLSVLDGNTFEPTAKSPRNIEKSKRKLSTIPVTKNVITFLPWLNHIQNMMEEKEAVFERLHAVSCEYGNGAIYSADCSRCKQDRPRVKRIFADASPYENHIESDSSKILNSASSLKTLVPALTATNNHSDSNKKVPAVKSEEIKSSYNGSSYGKFQKYTYSLCREVNTANAKIKSKYDPFKGK